MNTDKRRAYMREYMRLRRAVNKSVNTLSPAPAQTVCPPEAPPHPGPLTVAPARVVCSACRHLAATYHHCLVRREIVICNPDRAIECGEYVPAGRRAW
jgi:hypothetical protein